MNVEIRKNLRGKTVAVAVSGGADSMALLHYAVNNCGKFDIKVVALNVEHGIRGESSLRDTEFVKSYCKEKNISFIGYSVNAPERAKKDGLSVEQAARALRYECFFDAIASGKCDAVFTAHHSADNLESVLFNLFRGTGVKGLTGIKPYNDKIYRPLVKSSKEEINDYVKQHAIPFVDDETNFCDDYTRNFLRLNVIPKIKEIFPEAEKSVLRLSETLAAEDEFLDEQATNALSLKNSVYYLDFSFPRAILARAAIKAINALGLTRDYEKIHVDEVCALKYNENGKTAVLPHGIIAVREYDRIALFIKNRQPSAAEFPFGTGTFILDGENVTVSPVGTQISNVKNGFYIDADKVPANSVIRFRKTGDKFTKFGGGTKSLSDFFTDKKIPKKDRDFIPLIACGNEVLAVKGIAISDNVKIDDSTKNVIRIS